MGSLKTIGLGMAGSLLGIGLLMGLAWYQDIFTIDRDGTVYFRITTDGRVGMPNTPDATALLDLASTSKGFLMPRMTTAQRDVISTPATGLEVYNTTTNRAERYTGTAWKPVGISNVGARVYAGGTQTISNSAWTPLAFNSENYDTDSIHDTTANNSRLTTKTPGKYIITGHVQFAANTTGARALDIVHNGGSYIAESIIPATGGGLATSLCTTTTLELAVNDYVELHVYQSSGGSLGVTSNQIGFSMTLLQE